VNLYTFFGPTTQYDFGPDAYAAVTWAHVSRPGSNPAVYDMYEIEYRHNIGFPGADAMFVQFGNCYQCSSSMEANFMARVSTAPEPAPLASVGTALIGLVWLIQRGRVAQH
jgi:hypothetical protein